MTAQYTSTGHIPGKMAELESKGDIIAMATRSDGYSFWLVQTKDGPRIWAGCHDCWTLRQYRKHVQYGYGRSRYKRDRLKARETRLILDLFERRIKHAM